MVSSDIKWRFDLLMTITLLYLMSYKLVGEWTHEGLGVVMLLLLIGHHLLNGRWSTSLLHGTYSFSRLIQTTLVFTCFVAVSGSIVSGILLSRHVFAFLHPDVASSSLRQVHLLCANWGFILMALHLGFHRHTLSQRLRKYIPAPAWLTNRFILVVFSPFLLYGLFAFCRRNIPQYLTLKTQFAFYNFSEPVSRFLFDYILIFTLFVFIGTVLSRIIRRLHKNRPGK